MQHKFKTILELEVTVIAHVSPAVAPRPSMDPDSPTYSDPGDPGERSVEAVFLRQTGTGKRFDITDYLSDETLAALADEAYESASNV